MNKGDGRCINTGNGKGVTKVNCASHDANALIPGGGYCQDSSGTKYYKSCVCNASVYTFESNNTKNSCFNSGHDDKINSNVQACKAINGECANCKTCSAEGSDSAKWMSK